MSEGRSYCAQVGRHRVHSGRQAARRRRSSRGRGSIFFRRCAGARGARWPSSPGRVRGETTPRILTFAVRRLLSPFPITDHRQPLRCILVGFRLHLCRTVFSHLARLGLVRQVAAVDTDSGRHPIATELHHLTDAIWRHPADFVAGARRGLAEARSGAHAPGRRGHSPHPVDRRERAAVLHTSVEADNSNTFWIMSVSTGELYE